MRRLLLSVALLAGLAAPTLAVSPQSSDWSMYMRDAQATSSATYSGFNKVRLLWNRDLGTALGADYDPHSYIGPSLDDSGHLLVSASTSVYSLTLSSGGIVWKTTVTASSFSQPSFDSPNNRVYVSSTNTVLALNGVDGTLVWQTNVLGTPSSDMWIGTGGNPVAEFTRPSSVVLKGGSLYVSGNGHDGNSAVGGAVYRSVVKLDTSGVIQAAQYDGSSNSSVHPPVVSPDGTAVYVPLASNKLLSLSSSLTGARNWVVNINSPFQGVALGTAPPASNQIYGFVSATQFKLAAFHAGTGATLWTSAAQFTTLDASGIALDSFDNRLYFIADNTLYAYDLSGNQVFALALGLDNNGNTTTGPLTVAGPNTAYFVGKVGGTWMLHDIDTSGSGAIRWRLDYGGISEAVVAAPAVLVSTGIIAIHTGVADHAFNGAANGHHFVHLLGDASYTSVAVSSTPQIMTGSGTVRVTTVTVTVSGGAVAGVPVTPSIVSSPCTPTLSPSNRQFTDLLGQATFQVTLDYSSLPLSCYTTQSSTLTFSVPGMTDSTILVQETQASTFSVTMSTPGIYDDGSALLWVATMTFQVSNSTGGAVPNFPVAAQVTDVSGAGYAAGTLLLPGQSLPGSDTTHSRTAMTDPTGKATMLAYFGLGNFGINANYSIATKNIPNFSATVAGYAAGVSARSDRLFDPRVSTFTVVFSTPTIQPDFRSTTMTVTALSGATQIPNVPVVINEVIFASSGPLLVQFKNYGTNVPVGITNIASVIGYTDASGNAVFPMTLWNGGGSSAEFDSFNDTIDSYPVAALGIPISTVTMMRESNFLSGYSVSVPTISAVGVSFVSTVTAVNQYGHTLGKYNESTVNLVPLFAGTNVQGTGTLGTPNISFAGTSGQVVISSQNYNRIEDIDVKAVRGSGVTKTGLSADLHITGPDHFTISIPTGAAAGGVFIATITAVDSGGNRVVGYAGTIALSPVLAVDTSAAASGTLGVASVNMPANGLVAVSNESYSKGDGIRIRAYDSSAGIVGYSSSMTVTQPAMTIDHYGFQFPSNVSVGVPFRMEIDALDASSAPVTYSLDRSINIQAFIAGTSLGVSGSGSLGNSNVTIVAGSSYAVVAAQTYNKIETLQLKGTDQNAIVGASTFTLTVSGPDHFDVVMGTSAQAGQNFQLTVIARDASNNQVLGYNGTISLAAVQAATTTLSGGGVLGVTNLNVSGGQVTTAFQTYTKAEGIRLRISDSGIGVTSYSSSMTVTAGPPASLSLLANPQSTVAGVASVLTSTVYDLFNNAIAGSTVTFQLLNGSGTVAVAINALPSAVTSTNAVTGAGGQAQAFFASTNTLSAQADVLRAAIGSLVADTTIYNAVLIGPAGGTIVNFGDPNTKAIVPANAYAFNVRLALNEGGELAAADISASTGAMAKSPNTFVSTFTAKIAAVLDTNPNASAGAASQLVTVQFPFVDAGGGNVTVGSIRTGSIGASSLLVPFSVMRVFKLNKVTGVFETVLDGTNLPNLGSHTISAQVSDPNGIYAIGAPPYTPVSATSSGTITTSLSSGATATVTVPFGAFAQAAVVQVTLPSAGSVPALPGNLNMSGTGVTVSISAGGVQPVSNVGVSIGYTAADIANADPNTLRMARYDPSTGWVLLDSQVDTVAKTVTGQTNHFSLFQIVAVSPAQNVSQAFAFPNPFRPSQGHTTLGFANLPANAHVSVYSVSGRLLKSLDADSTGRVTNWAADDSSGRPLPSGVYIAVFVNGRDKKTFKLAIQR